MKNATKALACTAALACMGAVQAQDLPSSIWFDGYCDGYSNITAAGGGVVIGDYDLSNCTGYTDKLPSVGVGGSTLKSVSVSYALATFDASTFAPLFRIHDNGTATVYWTWGSSFTLTWTAGSPAQQGLRSGQPALLAPR